MVAQERGSSKQLVPRHRADRQRGRMAHAALRGNTCDTDRFDLSVAGDDFINGLFLVHSSGKLSRY